MVQNNKSGQEKILGTIQDLVKFRTVASAFEAFEQSVKYCEKFFAGTDVHIKKFTYSGHPALVILTKDTLRPKIMLQGHLDVVDGLEDQFSPHFDGDYLYGRGVVDMKGFDALAMHLVKDLSVTAPDFAIGLMLTFDEEIGSANGAARLAKEGILPDILINGDGGYNHAVIHAEKGILKIKLSVESHSGRHPYPWDGQNAFDLLLADYDRIKQLFEFQNDATDQDNWYTTYSAYDVKVENNPSFAPHYAEMKVNIYFTRDILCHDLFKKITGQIKHAKAEKFMCTERVYLEPDNHFIKSLQQIMAHKFKRPISIRSENGSSDARFFTNKGIPILIVKMVGEDHHGPKERLHVPSIMPMYNALKEFIETQLNSCLDADVDEVYVESPEESIAKMVNNHD